MRLLKWLARFVMKPVPVHSLVSIGSTSTFLETKPENYHIFTKIFHAEHIPGEISKRFPNTTDPRISSYQLKKITDHLLKEHTPKIKPILSRYRIPKTDLLQGIPCSICSHRPMERVHGKWLCLNCKNTSKDAHIEPIQDYILLFGSITNRECRHHIQLDEIHTVKRILNSMNLSYTGHDKNRTYFTKP